MNNVASTPYEALATVAGNGFLARAITGLFTDDRKKTLKVDPTRGLLSTLIVPPEFFTMPSTTESPRPVPSRFFLVAQQGSKIREI